MSFWETLVESNTFNFAILILIFAVLYRKLNVPKIIENIKSSIIQSIKNAEQEKTLANDKLKKAQKEIEGIDTDIKNKLDNAKEQAQGVSERITSNAQRIAKEIDNNVVSIINSEEKTISQKAVQDTLKLSTELAKSHIVNVLNKNPELHKKFIEQSIEEI